MRKTLDQLIFSMYGLKCFAALVFIATLGTCTVIMYIYTMA